MIDADDVTFGDNGLAPAVVRDASTGDVLMLAWMDREAFDATLTTGDVHFHSRSRDALWRKGETSGNVLRLVDITTDCDADALLVTADPAGPTCHRGTRSCFDDEAAATAPAHRGFASLDDLWATIAGRAATRPEGSYTARLLNEGVDATARKVSEEATEVLIAAKDHANDATAEARAALANEMADLLYHSLVLVAERGLDPSEVLDVLRERRR